MMCGLCILACILVQLRIWPCGIFLTPARAPLCAVVRRNLWKRLLKSATVVSIRKNKLLEAADALYRVSIERERDFASSCSPALKSNYCKSQSLVSAAAVDHCESVSDALIGRCRLAVFSESLRVPSHPRPSPHRLFH
ncbi:hypothetical protein BDZ85DRAFT_4613 [Elsinoe ampelina]|uniref:Secreted protein n=1 Tax=Elsinoe ampelina TaxID=302913 RepID=A0A6A6GP59_9PEZI|nr:hypothetical protein BDZ85DRAFT_4613 [Elsinoe ampelina]